LGASQQDVRVFFDSSAILSACGSEKSLSRLITLTALDRGWELVSSAYCRAGTCRNVGKFDPTAAVHRATLRDRLTRVPNALMTGRRLLLAASKDKPVLISTLAARSKTLLTLDTGGFSILLSTEVYGTPVTTPRDFLVREGF